MVSPPEEKLVSQTCTILKVSSVKQKVRGLPAENKIAALKAAAIVLRNAQDPHRKYGTISRYCLFFKNSTASSHLRFSPVSFVLPIPRGMKQPVPRLLLYCVRQVSRLIGQTHEAVI